MPAQSYLSRFMAQGTLPFGYSNFAGGLNTLNAPYLLTDNESRDLSNVQGTTAGAIVKRNGLVTFASPSATPLSLYASEATASRYLIASVGTTLVSIKTDGTVTSIKTGVTSGDRWSFVSAPVVSSQGPVFGMNGVDTPQYWTGATASTATANWTNASGSVSVPNGKYCVYKNNQVFVAGVSGSPSTVYWSAIANPTNWDPASLTGAGSVQLDPNDGQPITALGVVGPYVLVAKPRKLWVITDPASGSNRRISDQIGCVAHRSMVEGNEGTYFLSEDRGVYVTNGSTLKPLSDKILPSLNSIVSGQHSNAAGAYFNAHYYLSVCDTGSTNNVTYDYDAILGSWWRHTIASNQFAVWHPSGDGTEPGLYSAKASSGIVDECFAANTYTDNGSDMTWVWRGPWQSPSFYRRRQFPTPYFRKRLRQIRAQGFGTVDLSLAKNFAGLETLVQSDIFDAAVTGDGTFGGSDGTTFGASDGSIFGAAVSPVRLARIYGQGVADSFSLVLGSTSSTQDGVYLYMLSVLDRRDQLP